jgi:hypothetical protein
VRSGSTFQEIDRVPTVLENPGKSLNLFKKNPGLESPWKLIRSLKVLEFFFSRLEIIEELLPAQGLLLPKCLFSPISIKIMHNNCPKVVSMSFFF